METLANLESFVRSAEHGSFSAAARRLSLTPAAVSRNVAMLERNLGVRLFQRSTRRLTLTEEGEAFRSAVTDNLEGLQAAIAGLAAHGGEPAGTLKVSVSPTLGMMHVLPLLPRFRARYPFIVPEWHFDNRPVDVIGEGYDVAIGGGFERGGALVARALAPAHIVAVAAPSYLKRRKLPAAPDQLRDLEGIVMRSPTTGRVREWTMRDAKGREMLAPLAATLVVNDPAAMREAALLGLGVALTATADVAHALAAGTLVRLVPQWYADAGSISLYYASRKYLAPKTRVFVDWVVEAFRAQRLAARFSGARVG